MTETTEAPATPEVINLDEPVSRETFGQVMTALLGQFRQHRISWGMGNSYWGEIASRVHPAFTYDTGSRDADGYYAARLDLPADGESWLDENDLTETGKEKVRVKLGTQRAAELKLVRGRILSLVVRRAQGYHGLTLAQANAFLAAAGLPGYASDAPPGERYIVDMGNLQFHLRSTAADAVTDIRDRIREALRPLGYDEAAGTITTRINRSVYVGHDPGRQVVPDSETARLL